LRQNLIDINARIAGLNAEWADAGDDVPEELKIIRELQSHLAAKNITARSLLNGIQKAIFDLECLQKSGVTSGEMETVKHIKEQGSRRHVLSYGLYKNGRHWVAVCKCSEENCEINQYADEQLRKNGFTPLQGNSPAACGHASAEPKP
jgi:hypothetical protein